MKPGAGGNEIVFKILRYNPDKDTHPTFRCYTVKAWKGMTVLDGLMHIKETMDNTLSYRKSCRMGICGSCAMMVNGRPRLACQTQVSELQCSLIEVKPLSNYAVIRDLVPDLMPLFERHEQIKPSIIRDDREELLTPSGEYSQTPEELDQYLQFTYCIKCGCCNAACPTASTDGQYRGPQALAQCYRYTADSRDGGFDERIPAVDNGHGVWRCHFAGACSEVCPRGVDPAFAIQLLKRDLTAASLGLRKYRSAAPLAPLPQAAEKATDIPEAPPRTA